MRKNYEMTQKQFDKILDACKPTPVMYLSGGIPMSPSPQENANSAWRSLGEELGFRYTTVKPNSRGGRFFSAEEVGE